MLDGARCGAVTVDASRLTYMTKVEDIIEKSWVVKVQLDGILASLRPIYYAGEELRLVHIEAKIYRTIHPKEDIVLMVSRSWARSIRCTIGLGQCYVALKFILAIVIAIRKVRKAHRMIPIASITLVKSVSLANFYTNGGTDETRALFEGKVPCWL
jgi:hypothetical protein